MLFVLNTSLDPHFCALFDKDQNLIDQVSWEDRKQDGRSVFEFLEKHPEKLSFIGGISGPGGFSSLRAASSILQALALKYDLPIHQIRADDQPDLQDPKILLQALQAQDPQAHFLPNYDHDPVRRDHPPKS